MTREKTNEATVASGASTTHSYNIQILISMWGRLAKKLYICFQELAGKFGKRVSETLQRNQPPNIEYDCSTSGKMPTALVLPWMRKVLQPELKGASLLPLDSWSDQTDIGLSARVFGNRELNLHTKIIPPKTTKYCQPLDVYFFRHYKLFARRTEENIQHDEGNAVKLHDRIFIFKLHSLLYNQLRAPQHQPMLCYAWKASGYVAQDMPLPFPNVLDTNFAGLDTCSIPDCDCSSAIICSWWEIQLCLQHCLLTPHYHEVEWRTYIGHSESF